MKLSDRLQFLKEVKDVFDRAKIPFWIDFGTLLGFYRQGDFLETDPDIDIGVKREYQDEIIKIMGELNKIGRVSARVDMADEFYLAGYKIYKEDTWIDIAFYFECGDKRIWPVAEWPQVIVFDEKYFNNLEDIEIHGIKFEIPSYTEELMVLKYGKDWKRPFVVGEEYDLHLCQNIESNKKYLSCLK